MSWFSGGILCDYDPREASARGDRPSIATELEVPYLDDSTSFSGRPKSPISLRSAVNNNNGSPNLNAPTHANNVRPLVEHHVLPSNRFSNKWRRITRRSELGGIIDRISSIAFPIAFGIFNLVYWVYYLSSASSTTQAKGWLKCKYCHIAQFYWPLF